MPSDTRTQSTGGPTMTTSRYAYFFSRSSCMSPLVSSFQQEVVTSTGPYTSNISFLFLSQFTVENDFGTVLDTNGECDITSSGTSCSGNACSSANNNNCYRKVTSGIEAQKICIKMDCENWSASCDVDAWTVGFYTLASPPPPSTASPPPSR